jgi:hypothetical protein
MLFGIRYWLHDLIMAYLQWLEGSFSLWVPAFIPVHMEFVVEKVMGLSQILQLFQTSHVFSNVPYSFIITPDIGQINQHLTVLQPWSSFHFISFHFIFIPFHKFHEASHLTGPWVGLG